MQIGTLLQEPVSSPIHDALTEGEEVLSNVETVDFVPYVRVVLPIDGWVFWMNGTLLMPELLSQHNLQSSAPITVQCSLHYASVGQQDPDQTMVIRSIELTSPTEIEAFGALAADVMYIGIVNTPLGPFKFTFSRRNNFYFAAKMFHYVGDAIYPAFDNLIIEDQDGFDQRQVVSNSLPIWLSMFNNPPYPSGITFSAPIYPAGLVLENSAPPYIAVEVNERPSTAYQPIPIKMSRSSTYQQCVDTVRLITYGLRNDDIMDLRDYILDYSKNTGIIGIADPPVIMDVRRHQVEIAALAIKKEVELSVTYYQQRARDIARQLILKAGVNVGINPFPVRTVA